MSGVVVEHGETPFARRLRRRRIQVAVAVAAVEGVLLVVGVLPWWVAILAATAAVGLYVWIGREHASPSVRAVSWVAAVSQLIVVLVPVAIVLIGVLAVLIVALIAVVALTVLLLDRR